MEDRYVLVLISLNPDSSDLAGFVYPKEGYIEARHYKPDTNIRYGFYGTLWGECTEDKWLNTDAAAQWRVVRVDKNSEIIALDASQNFIKFRRGQVSHAGDKFSCAKYITDHTEFQSESLMGGELLSFSKDSHILSKGYESTACTENTGSHAINVATKGISRASGYMSHAVALGRQGEAIATGEDGHAISLFKSIAKGKGSRAVCIEDNGHVVVGKNGVGIALGVDCTAVGGEHSVLILAVKQGKQTRFAVGYVGEGLDAGIIYRLNPEGFFEEVGSPVLAHG